jgi:hypothetical protein
MTRGSLIWKIIVSSAAFHVDGKSKMAILFRAIFTISGKEIDTAPKALARNKAAIRLAPSRDKTRISFLRRLNLINTHLAN